MIFPTLFLRPIPPLGYVNLIFFISRLIFFITGIRFDDSRVGSLNQLADPALLQSRFCESLFYLHNQPPLFNAYIGLVLKLSPHHATAVFAITFLVLGWLLANAMYFLMVQLGASPMLGARLAVLCMISPSCVLYENWLFYTYPLAVLLCLSPVFLRLYLTRESVGFGFCFFLGLAFLVLMRSVFHIGWFLLILLMVRFYRKTSAGEILKIAGVPLALVCLLYLKNYACFHMVTGSSSWGMNLAKIALSGLSKEKLNQWAEEGIVSRMALIEPFSFLDLYRPYIPDPVRTGIPLLDEEVKRSGVPNFNHISYIYISQQYLHDSWRAIVADPWNYIQNAGAGVYTYFLPSNYYSFLHANRVAIKAYARAYNALVYGQWFEKEEEWNRVTQATAAGIFRSFFHVGSVIVVAYAGVLVYFGLYIGRNHKTLRQDPAYGLPLLVLFFNLVYISLAVNSTELGENQRYRYMTEPSAFVLLGVMISNMTSRTANHLRPDGKSGEEESVSSPVQDNGNNLPVCSAAFEHPRRGMSIPQGVSPGRD